MKNKCEVSFGSRRSVSNKAGWTDRIVEKNSLLDCSLLSENISPRFENFYEKNSQDSTILQLKSQILTLTNNCLGLNDFNQKLKLKLEEKGKKCSELEEKNKTLNEILLKIEEEK
jgi:hypothetical protein